ncbi:MAG: 23S rRNA (uracil(1939)-C(5))-methyltransferase RlmD [Lachnospiraceae bacterium]|nr:23S rRNA (uracil(1939)-C(5))-methyltransferase RlmD [Lachnospiraceae bacterium]
MTTSPCPVQKKCGGCKLSGVPYEKQLAEKQRVLQDLLGKFGKVEPILGMEDPYYYRGKVHRALAYSKGRILSGCYEANSHRVVDLPECLLEDRKCQEIASDVVKLISDFKLKVYDEDTGYGLMRHILVRRGFATDEIMLVLVLSERMFPGKNNFLKVLREAHPEITTIVQNVNPGHTSMILGSQSATLFGPGFIRDSIGDLTFRISPSSFFQVNPKETEILYRTAMEFAELTGKETVLDAYCGTGTIGLSAAAKAKNVVGVELNPVAVTDARKNAAENHITNIIFYAEDAGQYMERQAASRLIYGRPEEERFCRNDSGSLVSAHKGPYDVLFMDPPRTGATEKFIRSAAKLAPQKIVYISCGPDTLARDLALFTKLHYRVEKIQPVDMFPLTEHTEVVTKLSLR